MTEDAPFIAAVGLRVGYVMTHYPNATQTFISGEIDEVQRAGVKVSAYAMNAPSRSDQQVPDAAMPVTHTTYLKPQFVHALVMLIKFGLRHPLGTARVAAMAMRSAGGSPWRISRRIAHFVQAALVAHEAKAAKLDYLHAQFGLAPATIAWLASSLAKMDGRALPFGFTIHGFHDFVDRAESRLDLKARDATLVLCVSDFTRSQLCLVTDPKIWSRFVVARCGVDLTALTYRAPGQHRPPTVLAVGRLSAEKGFDVLIDALTILKRNGTPQRLVLVGDGPLRLSLEEAVANAGLSDMVEFTGELSPAEVRAHLSRADLFCLPSFNEGLPISIMEAMAVGVPVVTTWIAGIPELAESNVTALTVPPARPDALAAALERLANDEGLRLRLAEAARRRVEEHHDLSRCGRYIAQHFAAAVHDG